MTRLIALLCTLILALPLRAAELGDDGLYKTSWMRDTFKDMGEDLAEANAEGKRLLILMEQRGCIYCKKMHEEVFSLEEVSSYIEENFFVVQMDMRGSVEMTDFDGDVLPERAMARKWGLMFTPTMMFLPPEVDGVPASQAAVAQIPGAISAATTMDLLTWVVEERYLTENKEDFKAYSARRTAERTAADTN